jgi:hypothetical protein
VDSEERLRKIEDRLAAVERIVADAQQKFETFAKGPGKKILRTLGILP